MPAVIPAIAGLAASSLFTEMAVGALAGTAFAVTSAAGVMAVSVTIGAVAGGVVGGIQAAVTGGDIGKNMLYGAVGGAVGGAIGGAYNLGWFSSIGISGPGAGEGGSILGGAEVAKDVGVTTSQGLSAYSTDLPSAYTLPDGGAVNSSLLGKDGIALFGKEGATGGLLSGDMSKYALVTGGMKAFEGLMSKTPGETYANSEEGINAVLAQRQKEAELVANTAQKNINEGARQHDDTKAYNLYAQQKPYDEAEAARNRMRETATGLTLVKKQDVAAVKNQSDIDKELANYTKVA